MKLTPLFAIVFSVMLISLTSCRTSPIYNVPSQNFVISQAKYTEDDVKKAIISAGSSLGWSMKADRPGHILATLNIRAHMAQVNINYDLKKYAITYSNSANLKYDNDANSIHSNYNGWVQNLDRSIKAQLNNL